jgi:hypothetical protein
MSAAETHSQEQLCLLQMEDTADPTIRPADSSDAVEQEHKAPPSPPLGDGEEWLFDYFFDYFRLEQYGLLKLYIFAERISRSICIILGVFIASLIFQSMLEFALECRTARENSTSFYGKILQLARLCVGILSYGLIAKVMAHVVGLVSMVPFHYLEYKLGKLPDDPEDNPPGQEHDPVPAGDGEEWVFDPFFDYFKLDRLGREKLTEYARLISNMIRFMLFLYISAWAIVSVNEFICYLSFKFEPFTTEPNSFWFMCINTVPILQFLAGAILFFVALRMMFYVASLVENVPFDYLDHRFGKLPDKRTKKD